MNEHAATWMAHPWDTIGTPPPFGQSYEVVSGALLDPAIEKKVRDLIKRADECFERADELEEEAADERRSGEDHLGDAEELIESEIRPLLPDLAAELLKAAGR